MLCACGCGKETNLASKTSARRGWTKGQPLRFVQGHHCLRPLAERFWEKVDKRGPDECWLWLASQHQFGYGQINVHGRPIAASRIAYELTNGPIPEGLEALHTCNNPPCCNPNHLYAGTQTDNMQDAKRAGHLYQFPLKPGTLYPKAKLNDDKVRYIRETYATGTVKLKDLGVQFGVSEEMIWLIVHRKKWAHVP
jgi:hypothetical protein